MASENGGVRYLWPALLLLPCAGPAWAKIATDFDPNLDFSQLKTFAFIGGVEQLVRMPLNPDLLNPDKIWKTADNNIKDAFKRFPPSAKDIAAKKQQWAKEDAAKKPGQPQR